jgi:hypothetical protein
VVWGSSSKSENAVRKAPGENFWELFVQEGKAMPIIHLAILNWNWTKFPFEINM